MKKLLILIAILSIVACSTDKKGKQGKLKDENHISVIDTLSNPQPLINSLDDRNGFKDLKLGTKRKDISNKYFLAREGYLLQKPRIYQLLGADMKVFDYDIAVVILHFNTEDELDEINLNIGGEVKPSVLITNFTSLFGNPTDYLFEEDYFWAGSKVQLDLSFYPSKLEQGKTSALITITDLVNYKQKIKKGF